MVFVDGNNQQDELSLLIDIGTNGEMVLGNKHRMLHAKYMVEEEIKQEPMDWVIYRPTGYFYDIAKVFKPFIDKGKMQLLKGYGGVKANAMDCPDFAQFIVDHGDHCLYSHCVYHVQRRSATGKAPDDSLWQRPGVQGLC